jgi:hypothetical protein
MRRLGSNFIVSPEQRFSGVAVRTMTPAATMFAPSHLGTTALRALCIVILLSCHQAALASDSDLRVDGIESGQVQSIEGKGLTLWLGTEKGLFRWDHAPNGNPKHIDLDTGYIQVLTLDSNQDILWIGANRGLFRWDKPSGEGAPQQAAEITDAITKLHIYGSGVYVGTATGLYILEDVYAGGTKHFAPIGRVNALCQDGGQTLWIGSDKGLFRLDMGGGKALVPAPGIGHVTALYKEGTTLVIGTQNGLMRWDHVGDTAVVSPQRNPMFIRGNIYSLYKDEATLLISVNGGKTKGLFRWDDIHSGEPHLVDSNTQISSKYYRDGGFLWLGAGLNQTAQLLRWDIQRNESPRRVAVNTGVIHDFYKSGQTLWIGAQKGLFRVEEPGAAWDAGLHMTKRPPDPTPPNYGPHLQWQIDNYNWRTTPTEVSCRVIVKDKDRGDIKPRVLEVQNGRLEFDLPSLPEGGYELNIQATALDGGTAEMSEPVEFQVRLPSAPAASLSLGVWIRRHVLLSCGLVLALIGVLVLSVAYIPGAHAMAVRKYLCAKWGRISSYLKFCGRVLAEDYRQKGWFKKLKGTLTLANLIISLLVGSTLSAWPINRYLYPHRDLFLNNRRWTAIVILSALVLFLLHLIGAIKRFHERTVSELSQRKQI